MPKYLLNYQILSDFQVVVEAEDEDQAKEILIASPDLAGDIGGNEASWMQSDIYYDSIDIMEITE